MTQHIQIQDKFQGNAWFCNIMFESQDRTSLIDETRKILLDLVAGTKVTPERRRKLTEHSRLFVGSKHVAEYAVQDGSIMDRLTVGKIIKKHNREVRGYGRKLVSCISKGNYPVALSVLERIETMSVSEARVQGVLEKRIQDVIKFNFNHMVKKAGRRKR